MQQSAEILFDKYEVIECLKKDLHNAVYIANHIYLGKKIVLKTLDTGELQDNIILERFKREARILALLDHPNLIKILDFGTFGNHFYISFEYFEGTNLRELITQKKLNYDQKTHLLVQLLKALNVAHQNSIIHRDIKPENILINSNYELKIADFGLAVVLNDDMLTNKASIVGTPGYMSPEQILGDDLSVSSDIFSAGIVALELFTGENPFIGKNINETINNILNYKEERIDELVRNLSPSIQQTIKLMLRRNPSERGKNINELLSTLGVAGEIYTPVDIKIRKKYSRKMMLGAAAGSISFFALLYLFFSQGELAPSKSFGNPELMKIINEQPVSGETGQKTDSSLSAAYGEKPGNMTGRLFVKVSPWADIYINNRKVSTTPLDDYIKLNPGDYNLKLVHPDYPSYTRKIKVGMDKIENVSVDFNKLAGYLDCQVYPWAEVYINDDYKSQTPLRKPIILFPGFYTLTIKNPKFESFTERIRISSGETFNFKYNFEEKKQY